MKKNELNRGERSHLVIYLFTNQIAKKKVNREDYLQEEDGQRAKEYLQHHVTFRGFHSRHIRSNSLSNKGFSTERMQLIF